MESEMPDVSGFRRAFRDVYHTSWFYAKGETDVLESALRTTEMVHANNEFPGVLHFYKPLLTTDLVDSLLMVEKYEDFHAWTAAEVWGQTSPGYFDALVSLQSKQEVSVANTQVMVEDTLDASYGPLQPHGCVQWSVYRAPIAEALFKLPTVAVELEQTLHQAGFQNCKVRYFGMPSGTGSNRNLAHLWIEFTDVHAALDATLFQEGSAQMRAWRKQLRHAVTSIERRNLFQFAA